MDVPAATVRTVTRARLLTYAQLDSWAALQHPGYQLPIYGLHDRRSSGAWWTFAACVAVAALVAW